MKDDDKTCSTCSWFRFLNQERKPSKSGTCYARPPAVVVYDDGGPDDQIGTRRPEVWAADGCMYHSLTHRTKPLVVAEGEDERLVDAEAKAEIERMWLSQRR